jgi:hypothetical protein
MSQANIQALRSGPSGTTTRPRKSTLTQQQKNKKRQRATPAQLAVLKREFAFNETPNAKSREEIGRKIDMTERSVQIWFQNKRAKQKLFKRKQHMYPEIMGGSLLSPGVSNDYVSGTSLHSSPLESTEHMSGGFVSDEYLQSVTPSSLLSPYTVAAMPRSSSSLGINIEHPSLVSTPLLNLPCSELTIGYWRRVCQGSSSELMVCCSPPDATIFYVLRIENTGFLRIEIPFKSIEGISVSSDNVNPELGRVTVRLNCKPSFSSKTPMFATRWTPCDDFSEGRQVSRVLVHKLLGPYIPLQRQLWKLHSLLPGKVSIAFMTPPQTASSTHSFKDDIQMLSVPERSQTRSTPALFINTRAKHNYCDSLSTFDESISDTDLSPIPTAQSSNQQFISSDSFLLTDKVNSRGHTGYEKNVLTPQITTEFIDSPMDSSFAELQFDGDSVRRMAEPSAPIQTDESHPYYLDSAYTGLLDAACPPNDPDIDGFSLALDDTMNSTLDLYDYDSSSVLT